MGNEIKFPVQPEDRLPDQPIQIHKPKEKILLDERGMLDMPFLLLTVLLVAIGVVMMFSASYASAYAREDSSTYYFSRQGLFAIVGIGINCSQKEDEFPPEIASIATSLSIETNKAVDRSRMIAALIESFYEMDENLLSEKAQIMEQYRQNCITLGKHISIHRDKDPFYGVALQIDDNGALIVEHPNGKRETINSGEASIRGMYGYI